MNIYKQNCPLLKLTWFAVISGLTITFIKNRLNVAIHLEYTLLACSAAIIFNFKLKLWS